MLNKLPSYFTFKFGVEVCRRTLPLDVECREQNGISASFKNGSCSLSRLQCVSGVHTNGLTPCPDFKVRFKCSVTRGLYFSRFIC